jgi:exonuclease VII small subunit
VLVAPRNPQGHKDLANIQERLKDKLADIDFAVNLNLPRSMVADSEKEKEQAKLLRVGAKRGDGAAVEEAINEIAQAIANLRKTGLLEARNEANPKNKKDFEDILSGLEKLLQDLEASGKKAAANPNNDSDAQRLDKDLDNLADKVKKLLSVAKAEPVAAGHELLRSEDRVVSAARQHDPKALSDAAKLLNEDLPKFVDKVRKEGSKIEDPQKRKDLALALEDLKALNGQVIGAALEVAKDPYNPVSQRKLGEAVNAAKQIIEEIELDLKPPFPYDKAGLAKAKKYEGAKAARAKKYPQAKDLNPYEDTLRSLEDLLAQLEAATLEANRNPNDAAAKKRLAELVKKVKQATDKTSSLEKDATPEQKLAALILKEDDDADKLLQGTRNGDAPAVAENAKNLVASSKNVTEAAKALASNMDPVKKQALLNSISELEHLLPEIVNASKMSLQKPNDAQAAAKVIFLFYNGLTVIVNCC